MTEFPYAYSTGKLSVEVWLQCASDVWLVDERNFQRFRSGQEFRYHGGRCTYTPVRITVLGCGRWYLVVRGNGKYQYRFLLMPGYKKKEQRKDRTRGAVKGCSLSPVHICCIT